MALWFLFILGTLPSFSIKGKCNGSGEWGVGSGELTLMNINRFGTLLMEEAERIAIEEHGSEKLAVISGVGTRHYYRKLGYGRQTILHFYHSIFIILSSFIILSLLSFYHFII